MRKGIMAHAEEGAFLHCVVLVNSMDDRLGQSRQAYRLYIEL